MTTPLVQSITDEMVAELEASAMAATLGPWGWDGPVWGYDRETDAPWLVSESLDVGIITGELKCGEADALYIALSNPATILALLAERKELVRDRDRLDWLADPDNTIGNVQLPLKCVTANFHSLRDAIDAARREV